MRTNCGGGFRSQAATALLLLLATAFSSTASANNMLRENLREKLATDYLNGDPGKEATYKLASDEL